MAKMIDIVMYVLAGAIIVSLATSIEISKMHYESMVDEFDDAMSHEAGIEPAAEVGDVEAGGDEAVKKKLRIIPKFMRKNLK